MHPLPCPICAAPTREYCRKRRYGEEWIIRRCRRCGHGFVSNRPSAERLREIYAEDDRLHIREISAAALETNHGSAALADRIASLSSLRGPTLDVGSGRGAHSYHLCKRGYGPLLMIDVDDRGAEAVKYVPGSEFRLCAFEDLESDERFAVIVMSHVLEHALDPVDWLGHARAMLNPQGILAVVIPNFGGVYRVLGSRDPMLIPPLHLNYFTARSLRAALRRSGLQLLSLRSRSQVPMVVERRKLSVRRVILGRIWNALSPILDRSTRGVTLQCFARPTSQ